MYAEEGAIPTFARDREQNQATVPRNVVGDQALDQLDIPLLPYFSIGN